MAWAGEGYEMDRVASRAKYYREKAEELQQLVPKMSSKEAKKSFTKMAADYLEMAAKLERLAAEKPAS